MRASGGLPGGGGKEGPRNRGSVSGETGRGKRGLPGRYGWFVHLSVEGVVGGGAGRQSQKLRRCCCISVDSSVQMGPAPAFPVAVQISQDPVYTGPG